MDTRVAIIGGGAAGMMAAVTLKEGGADVIVLEHNEKLGKKLYITGKGRCNLTNDCALDVLFENIVHGGKFLRSALSGFTPQDTMAFFEGLGLKLKVERGNRVFPASDKASDVIKALTRRMDRLGVDVRLNTDVKEISRESDEFIIETSRGKVHSEYVVIATGGAGYPSTGSTGDGYAFAGSVGHRIVPPMPALTSLHVKQNVAALKGISLRNVRLTAYSDGREVASDFGEMSFTDRGVSGPIALTISSYVARAKAVRLALDLKPALDEKTLDARLVREFSSRSGEDIKHVMRALLPEGMNGYVLYRAGVDPTKKVSVITKEERIAIISSLKSLSFDMSGCAPFSEAVITSGGVDLKEVSPCGESKLCKGLYFAGEVLDVDALTGGFNLQIAWATAVNTARNILKRYTDHINE